MNKKNSPARDFRPGLAYHSWIYFILTVPKKNPFLKQLLEKRSFLAMRGRKSGPESNLVANLDNCSINKVKSQNF
jgi:hypothetical protein